jgi:predicted ABC-type ATPase
VSGRKPPPRVRMFAGPNGSGKTTVQRNIVQQFPSNFLGVLINPDDLEAMIGKTGRLDLEQFSICATKNEVREAFTSSAFLGQNRLAEAASVLDCDGRTIDFTGLAMNSYYASVLADFLRRKLLAALISFSFETVMSEKGKVDFLRQAQSLGFRNYLYYVATEDPEINVSRVAVRVTQGGHDVPKEKIASRYHRSLELVRDAIRHTDRAYFFDTSQSESVFVAESADGERPVLRCDRIPNWFKIYVWDKF